MTAMLTRNGLLPEKVTIKFIKLQITFVDLFIFLPSVVIRTLFDLSCNLHLVQVDRYASLASSVDIMKCHFSESYANELCFACTV